MQETDPAAITAAHEAARTAETFDAALAADVDAAAVVAAETVAAPAVHDLQPIESGSARLARVGEELLAWMKTLTSAAVYHARVTFGFQVARVEGRAWHRPSNQDRLIVSKLGYRLYVRSRRHRDALLPGRSDKSFVKRVVAGPGGNPPRREAASIAASLPDDFIRRNAVSDTWGPEE